MGYKAALKGNSTIPIDLSPLEPRTTVPFVAKGGLTMVTRIAATQIERVRYNIVRYSLGI